MTPRHQTQTERDLEGLSAKRKREAVPEYTDDDDDFTGKFHGPDLWDKRRSRPDSKRLERLEWKCDEQALIADQLRGNEWKRRTIDRVITAVIALVTGYLLGRP